MFSKTVEYALRAMVHLVGCQIAGQGGQNLEQIAMRTEVPVAYLSKVMQSLVRAQLVTSQRGVGGGFRVARAAEDITILEVVSAVDPLERITTCPLGLEIHGTQLCPLHKKMDEALAFIEKQFGDTTLAAMTGDSLLQGGPLGALCAVPAR